MQPQSSARPTLRGSGGSGLWTLDLELLDRAVRVESPDEGFLLGLSACFPPLAAHAAPSPAGDASPVMDLTVHIDPRPPGSDPRVLPIRDVQASSPAFTLPWPVRGPLDLCSALNQWAALSTRRYYVFHAGAVARADKALLMPAASGSGKSTTTAGLLRRGFQLLSDELGAVDMATDRVSGYARALSLRDDVLALLGLEPEAGVAFPPFIGRLVEPEALGSSRAPAAGLALVVVPRYLAGAETRLERLRGGAALMALMQSSCSQSVHKVAGLDWVIALVSRVPCYELTFSALDQGLALLVDTFDRHAAVER